MKILMHRFCYFTFLVFFTANIYAQNPDLLIDRYENLPKGIEKAQTADSLFILLRKTDLPLAIAYLRQSLSISRSVEYGQGEALALHNLGKYHGREREIDSIRHYFGLAAEAYEGLSDNKELFSVYHNWVRLENLEGFFDDALELSMKSIDLALNLKNGEMLSDAYQRRATIYLDEGEYQLAIEALVMASRVLDTVQPPLAVKKAIVDVGIGRTDLLLGNFDQSLIKLHEGLQIFVEQKEEMWQAITHMEIGAVHYDLKDWDMAINSYNSALEISRKNQRDDFIAAILGNLAGVFIEQKKYDEALEYLFESNQIALKRGSITNQIITFNDIASAYFGKKDYQRAIQNYDQAITLADSIGSLDVLSDAYVERSRAYEEIGAYKQALKDQKQFQIVHDSVFNILKTEQIEELKTKYETEKKEQQIALQDNEIALLEQKQKATTLQNILLILGLLAISIIFILTYYGLRQRMKRNRAERQKLDGELAFKKKELTTHALHLAKKNEVLEGIKQRANELRLSENSNGYKELIRAINFDQQDDKNWENFTQYFEQVHKDFSKIVKSRFPEITKNELRLMALLKMNLSSKEIATILNISQEGIKKARYRLRKKLDINTEESLQDMVLSL